jgi:hypothetical protein
MLSRKQFLDRGILTTLCLSALGALIPQLHADDLSDFDQKQSERLSAIQEGLKEKKLPNEIAKSKLDEVNAQLKKYGQFGPNRIRVASRLATEKVKKDVLSALGVAAHSDEEGAFSYVANKNLEEKYGISLVFDNVKKTWKAKLAGNSPAETQRNLKKFTDTIKKNVSPPELWNEMGSEAREILAANALSSLSPEIQGIVSDDDTARPEIKEKINVKVQSLGGKDSGEIQKLEKELIEAETKDGSEKRLLLAEQKTYESLGKGEAGKSIDDVCRDFAQNVSNEIDLKRRLSSFEGKDDPCSLAFKEVAIKNNRKLAAGAPGSELGVGKIGAFTGGGTSSPSASPGHKGNDEEPNDPENSVGGDKIKKQKSYLSSAEQKKLKETHPEIAEKFKDFESKYNQAMGVIDAQSKQAIINSCNQAAANLKKSIGLGSDNEKNEKIVSGITDKLEKTLAKGYQGLVCDKSGANDGLATNASMEEASKDVLKGLGIPATGPLTQSKQNTLESLSKGAMEVAANFANQRRNRMKLDFQMLEAASKKALSRIATENPNLMDANTLSYLRTLSYNELMGVIPNALPSFALQTYQNYFDIAVMDIKQKNGMGEEFDKQAECALVFAQTATQRWAEEEDRKGLLSLRVRGSSGLPVSNGTTVRNEESTRKVERNR